ncbi:MAG: hypothetical protein J7L38_01955 [Thermoproteales archaeon]|nr:hypothetical protein [Thermoproteales archaeon]
MPLAHGVTARLPAAFNNVVKALELLDHASSVYLEVFETQPRMAIAVGEKYFFRAGNYLSSTTLVIEDEDHTIVKIVASGGRRGLLDLFDLGSAKDYANDILYDLCGKVGVKPETVVEVDYLDKSRSNKMKIQ